MKDLLDTAIDQVTAHMVHVEDDASMAARIVSALPERSRFGWLIPQFALIGTFVLAAIVWTMRDNSAPQPLLPSSRVAVVTTLPGAAVSDEPRTALRTPPLARLEPLESASARGGLRELRRDRAVAAFGREGGPLELSDGDFERSLSPIQAMRDLVISEVAPKDLPAADAMVLAPLEIAALPLSAAPDPRY